jgi:uncharacterized protein YprB with RNaseH-like and TPR domain
MENRLRKRLAFIKKRAQQLRKQYLAGRPAPMPSGAEPPCSLDEAAPGEERRIESSPFYVIRTMGEHVVEDASELAARFLHFCKDPSHRGYPGPGPPGREAEPPHGGEQFCFFDIETTGLSPNTYVFLCGMMTVEDGCFVIDQAFARDYSEETGMLRYVRDTFRRYSVLVTFNGVSFDVPFVRTRMKVARIDYEGPPEHIDLLPRARRFFGGTLPNCRLETIERHLRGIERRGDIPGRDIPEAYHEFVRTGNANRVKRILYHNRMDLLAMAYLFNHIAAGRSR